MRLESLNNEVLGCLNGSWKTAEDLQRELGFKWVRNGKRSIRSWALCPFAPGLADRFRAPSLLALNVSLSQLHEDKCVERSERQSGKAWQTVWRRTRHGKQARTDFLVAKSKRQCLEPQPA